MRKRASLNVPTTPEQREKRALMCERLEAGLAGVGGRGERSGDRWGQVILSQAPGPSAPDSAAALETGQVDEGRAQRGVHDVLQRKKEPSRRGPTPLSAGRHAGSCVTEPR